MSFMNGGFRWTVLILLGFGTWLAGSVATLQLRERSDRKVAFDAAQRAIAFHDSTVHIIADSLLAHDAHIMADLDILRERSYRYDDVFGPPKAKKHAQERSERDERRHWP